MKQNLVKTAALFAAFMLVVAALATAKPVEKLVPASTAQYVTVEQHQQIQTVPQQVQYVVEQHAPQEQPAAVQYVQYVPYGVQPQQVVQYEHQHDANCNHQQNEQHQQQPQQEYVAHVEPQTRPSEYPAEIIYVNQPTQEVVEYSTDKQLAQNVAKTSGVPATILAEVPVRDIPQEVLQKLRKDFGVKVVATRERPGANLLINCDEYTNQDNSLCRSSKRPEAPYQVHPHAYEQDSPEHYQPEVYEHHQPELHHHQHEPENEHEHHEPELHQHEPELHHEPEVHQHEPELHNQHEPGTEHQQEPEHHHQHQSEHHQHEPEHRQHVDSEDHQNQPEHQYQPATVEDHSEPAQFEPPRGMYISKNGEARVADGFRGETRVLGRQHPVSRGHHKQPVAPEEEHRTNGEPEGEEQHHHHHHHHHHHASGEQSYRVEPTGGPTSAVGPEPTTDYAPRPTTSTPAEQEPAAVPEERQQQERGEGAANDGDGANNQQQQETESSGQSGADSQDASGFEVSAPAASANVAKNARANNKRGN